MNTEDGYSFSKACDYVLNYTSLVKIQTHPEIVSHEVLTVFKVLREIRKNAEAMLQATAKT